jgi:flagellar biosynthesis protein FlhF
MRLKTYSAPSMAKAMAMVREELGEDAIIVSTRSGPGGRTFWLTAAIEEPPDAEDGNPSDDWGEDDAAGGGAVGAGGRIAEALTFHGVPAWLRERLSRLIADRCDADPATILAAAIDRLLAFDALDERRQAAPLMLVGPPGAGKTIACAKLLFRAKRAGRPVVALSADARRAGAVEQLEAFTRILGVPLLAVDGPQALRAALMKTAGALAIIDTAGTNPLREADMAELSALITAARAEPVLVAPVGADVIETAEQAQIIAALGVRRLLATKLDLSRRFGAMLAAAAAGPLAIAGVGVSGEVADTFSPLTPHALARLLLPQEEAVSLTPTPKEAFR